jgi:UDP-GlcNAc:undecaprenyl-phosphate GlcNAc-1-phosphate transferase
LKTAIAALVFALVVSWAATPWVIRLATSRGVLDQPDPRRRVHERPTPRWGGIAIWLGVVVGLGLAAAGDYLIAGNFFLTHQLLIVLGGATVIAAAGLADDKYDLSALWQFAILVAVSLVVALLGVRINYVTNPFGESLLWLHQASIPVTVGWLFFVTKTIDLADGLDGLAAGVCAISSAALAVLGLLLNTHSVAVVCAAVTGASLGFLRYNYPPAKIFMGTIGAQFMGFMLAGAAVIGPFKVAATFAVVVPILALGIPMFDAVFAFARRAASGKPVYVADRGHLHHRLLDAGLTVNQVILVIYAATLVLSVGALLLALALKG